MRTRSVLVLFIALVLLLAASSPAAADPSGPSAPATAVGTTFSYQGQLKTGSAPVNGNCDFQFSAWDSAGSGTPPTGGTQFGGTQSLPNVAVANGLFTVPLDFGSGVFTTDARWLQIVVRCPTGGGSYTTLAPRQALTAAPFALALPGLYTTGSSIPNIVGGYSGNSVGASVSGSTIAGGGEPGNGCGGPCSNRVLSNWSAIGGGFGNLAGAGGVDAFETVGGGAGNTASSDSATVGGGNTNAATGQEATVAGGRHNTAGGYAATVPGGEFNTAGANYSLAAGRDASADHTGAFVWADTSGGALHSTGDNQFLVRAAGGVGINNNSPAAALDVKGTASGTLRVGTGAVNGTIFSAIQGGTFQLGSSDTVAKTFTVTFPSTFSAVPHVVITVRNQDGTDFPDTFVASTRRVNTSQLVVNVVRVDFNSGWSQILQLDWVAWQ